MSAPGVAPRPASLVLGVVAIAVGVTTLAVARDRPDLSLAAGSGHAQVVFLLAGWLVAAAGLAKLAEPQRSLGTLLVAAGGAWFIAELDSPAAEPAALFTVGLVGAAAAPAVVAHAGLALARPRGWRALAVAGYLLAVGVLGFLAAAVFDPVAEGCVDCPANLLRIASDPHAHAEAERWGFWLAGALYAGTSGAARVVARHRDDPETTVARAGARPHHRLPRLCGRGVPALGRSRLPLQRCG